MNGDKTNINVCLLSERRRNNSLHKIWNIEYRQSGNEENELGSLRFFNLLT